jgi:hypothetical protein
LRVKGVKSAVIGVHSDRNRFGPGDARVDGA